jgi:hypothetical protein
MSTKLSLKEKLALAKKNREEKEKESREVKTDTQALQPIAEVPATFTVVPSTQRVERQRVSRKRNPKEIIISNPNLQPSKENEPRYLNNDELDYLLIGIPIPAVIRPDLLVPLLEKSPNRPRMNFSSDPDVSYLIYTEIIQYQRFLLSEMKLTPSALTDFRTYMTLQFQLARSVPGTTVGVQCGDSVSAPITQSTLNSFHSSGTSKSISYGIDYLKELIDATEKRKQTTNSIHSKNKFMGFERILEFRRRFVEVNLGNLVVDYEILPQNELNTNYWYSAYIALYKTPISSFGLRLYLNPQLMFDYRISLQELRDALIREKPGLITVIIAPTHENILDIFPVEAQIGQAFKGYFKDKEVDSTPTIFLHNLILPLLNKIKIKGVDKITNLFPVSVPTWALVKSAQKISNEVCNCIYDPKVITINKLGPDRVISLLTYLGFKILENYDKRTVVQMPADYNTLVSGKSLNPNEYVLAKIDQEKERLEDEYEKSENFIYPYSELMNLAQYWIAETNGSNLEALFAFRDLDHDILTTNDIHEAKDIYGIEGAKHVLLKEFVDALDSLGSGTDPRHLVLMTDFMTNKGDYFGFTAKGVGEQETSAFEQASFERANETLFNIAVFGERLPVTSVTPSVFVGASGAFGTNYNRVIPNPSEEKKSKARADNISRLSVQDAENALDIYNDPDAFTIATPTLQFPGNAEDEFDPTLRRLLVTNASNTILGTPTLKNQLNIGIGLPINNTKLTLNTTVPAIGLPGIFTGKLEQETKFNPVPIRSELLTSSVVKISGVPRLDNPEPIHLPKPTLDFYQTNLPVELKTPAKTETKVIGIPTPSSVNLTPVVGLTSTKLSGVPNIPGIPKLPLKGIPPIKISLPSSTTTSTVKPINIGNFLQS